MLNAMGGCKWTTEKKLNSYFPHFYICYSFKNKAKMRKCSTNLGRARLYPPKNKYH